MSPPLKPLADLRVLDFSRYIAGPYCATLLSQFGAEVIKIEPPGIGDECRTWPPLKNGFSGYFASVNRGKKSLTLNLKSPDSRTVVNELVKKSDVLVHSFTAGVCKKLELGYETISEVNPELVYCSISGFGADGPYRNRKGFDTIFQAMGGVTWLTGEEDGSPVKAGVPIADVSSGAFAALSIMTALYNRWQTHKGEYIDMALMDSVLNFLPVALSFYALTGEVPKRMGSQHPGRVPSATFQCSDGKYVHISVTDDQWHQLCLILDLQELLTDEFARNENRVELRDIVMEKVGGAIARIPRSQIVAKCLEKAIPCGEVFSVDEVITDENVKFRNAIAEFEAPGIGKMVYASFPAKFKGIETQCERGVPQVGEDTVAILKSVLNYDAVKINELQEKGIV